jgi:hypothetical protein
MEQKNKLIEAAAAFLHQPTSSSVLNEYKKEKPNNIESSAYTPEKNSDGKTLTTTLYAKEYKNRAAEHEKDLNKKGATPEDRKVDKGHMERANAAHEAHTHAISVHHSPTASPNEKRDAVKKAVHAQLKYWKHEPMSHTDARSDRGEEDYHTRLKRYLGHPDMKSVKEAVLHRSTSYTVINEANGPDHHKSMIDFHKKAVASHDSAQEEATASAKEASDEEDYHQEAHHEESSDNHMKASYDHSQALKAHEAAHTAHVNKAPNASMLSKRANKLTAGAKKSTDHSEQYD